MCMYQHKNPGKFPNIAGAVIDGAKYSTTCAAYVIITEEQRSTTTTLCAGQSQETHVYTSTSNMVEISFVQTNMDDEKPFIVEYEGTPIKRSIFQC